MMKSSLHLLLRFLSDRQSEVSLSVSSFISELLRMVSFPRVICLSLEVTS